ncbi:hypothetical protein F4802DRAFT_426753 [Xylaria palmicola]|nr:hypothetical protein F4802DRAFT_426753 [Xylaria palmicola]
MELRGVGRPSSGINQSRLNGNLNTCRDTDFISSDIIDHLRYSRAGSSRTAGYYFNAREDAKRNVSRLLRSLILQLCSARNDWPAQLKELRDQSLSQGISDGRLSDVLKDLIREGGDTYIVIDALDECDMSFRSGEASESEKLAGLIDQLIRVNSNLHLLVTSRDGGLAGILKQQLEDACQENMTNGSHRYEIDLEVGWNKEKVITDVDTFIQLELERWDNLKDQKRWLPLDETKRNQIANAINERANGMFRLAFCLLDLVWKQERWDMVELALNDLPPELPKVYDRIFEDIRSQGRIDTAKVLICWILYSEHPLSLEKLTEVTMVDAEVYSFDVERGAQNEGYVASTLSSFITISRDSLVQFAHQTVKDYLLMQTTEGGFFAQEAESHRFIAKYCLAYMQFFDRSYLKREPIQCAGQFRRIRRYTGPYVLLEYTVNNWHIHAKHALLAWRNPTTTNPRDEPQPLLHAAIAYGKRICRSVMGNVLTWVDGNADAANSPQSLSDWAASVDMWLDQVPRIESVSYDSYHNTLGALAGEGYERLIQLLLTINLCHESDIDFSFDPGALIGALFGDYDGMIRCILGDYKIFNYPCPQPLNIQRITRYKSYERIVSLLLDIGINANWADISGMTALHVAAILGHEPTTRILLEGGADIHARDRKGRTALHAASFWGCDRVVELLLDKGADIRARDNTALTALDLAVWNAVENPNPHDWDNNGYFPKHNIYKGLMPVVMSDGDTIAHTIRILSGMALRLGYGNMMCNGRDTILRLAASRPDAEEHDTETQRPASEPSNQVLGPPRVWPVILWEGDDLLASQMAGGRFIIPYRWSLKVDGGFIHIGMSTIEQLLTYGQFFTHASAVSSRPRRPYTCYIGPATHIGRVVVSPGTINFSVEAIIGTLSLREGATATFSAPAEIGTLSLWGGATATFSAPAGIVILSLREGTTATFSAPAEIGELYLRKGATATFSAPAEIGELSLAERETATFSAPAEIGILSLREGATATFSAPAEIGILSLREGATATFSAPAEIGILNLAEGTTATFSAAAKIGKLYLTEGATATFSAPVRIGIAKITIRVKKTVFTYGIREEIINLLIGETAGAGSQMRDDNGVACIGTVVMDGGNFIFLQNCQIGVFDGLDGLDGREVNIRMEARRTPLALAANRGLKALARLLLEKGADPNARLQPEDGYIQVGDERRTNCGWAALHEAAFEGQDAIVKLLLDNKADIDIEDAIGRTALTIAESRGHTEIVRLLEENGLRGQTMLQVAVRKAFSLFRYT